MHTLLDQPERISIGLGQPAVAPRGFEFGGTRPFGREETNGLRRAIRILHEVITGNDHSSGTLHSWRNIGRRRFDVAVESDLDRFAEVHRLFKNEPKTGMKVDYDRLADELAGVWSGSRVRLLTPVEVASVVRRFVPLVMGFSNQDPMQAAYDAARSTLDGNAT